MWLGLFMPQALVHGIHTTPLTFCKEVASHLLARDRTAGPGVHCFGKVGAYMVDSQNYGYLFGGPYNKDYGILGFILGSLIQGNYHIVNVKYPKRRTANATLLKSET